MLLLLFLQSAPTGPIVDWSPAMNTFTQVFTAQFQQVLPMFLGVLALLMGVGLVFTIFRMTVGRGA